MMVASVYYVMYNMQASVDLAFLYALMVLMIRMRNGRLTCTCLHMNFLALWRLLCSSVQVNGGEVHLHSDIHDCDNRLFRTHVGYHVHMPLVLLVMLVSVKLYILKKPSVIASNDGVILHSLH